MTVLAEAVHFEVTDLAAAVRLTRRLAQTWIVSLRERGEVNLVSAALRTDPGELGVMLRTVESWVEEESLCMIRFQVDGREYVLQAGEADWRSAPHTAQIAPNG
jgi:hypothetical protein